MTTTTTPVPMFCARCGAKVTAPPTRPLGNGGFYCDECARQATLDREPLASRRDRSRLPLALVLLTIAVACVAAVVFAVRSTGAVPPPAERATAAVPPMPRPIAGATPAAPAAADHAPDDHLAVINGRTAALRASAAHSFTFDESTLDWPASPPRADDAGSGRPPAAVIGATAAADGRSGAALAFGGPGRRVEVPDSPVDGSAGGLTLAAWVRLDRAGSGSVIDRADWAGGPTRGYVLRVIDGRADLTVGGEDTWHSVATDRPLPVGRWVHLAATYDGRAGVVYVDGRPAASGPLPRPVPSRRALWIGCGSFEIARERVFPGTLDEVGVFDRALTSDDVRLLATSAGAAATR